MLLLRLYRSIVIVYILLRQRYSYAYTLLRGVILRQLMHA